MRPSPIEINLADRHNFTEKNTGMITNLIAALAHALWMAFAMFWEILWPLILGFGLSGVVQAVVSKSEMSRLLPDDSPKSLAIATGLGAASSSCSYAAVALATAQFARRNHCHESLFRDGLGGCVERHRVRFAHRRRARRLGAARFLEYIFSNVASGRCDTVGATRRTIGRGPFLRLLGR